MSLSAKKNAQDRVEVSYFDEANVARLGLISIQERIPEGFNRWSVDLELDGRKARLTCEAVAERGGVPHGLDNDVSMALIALYQEAGFPEDGVVVTNAYQILKVMGWHTGGHYYQSLKDSLGRLATTTYTASEAWRRGPSWTSVMFRYIDRLEYTSENDKLELKSSSVLKIKLAPEITQSIRARYIKPVDLAFLTSLERPLTRALYRLLDSQRITTSGQEVVQFRTNIIGWAEACKIIDKYPAKVRRTLEAAHEELVERGYLSAVDYQGRGSKQEIVYSFAKQPVIPEEGRVLVDHLMKYKVSRQVANGLITTYGLERVKERIQKFEALLAGGYQPRNRAGILVDVIRDEEGKYSDPEGFVSETRRVEVELARAKRFASEKRLEERKQKESEAEWEVLDAEGRAAKAIRNLQFMFGRKMGTRYYAGLSDAFRRGSLDPKSLLDAAYEAQASLMLEHFRQELEARLDQGEGMGV